MNAIKPALPSPWGVQAWITRSTTINFPLVACFSEDHGWCQLVWGYSESHQCRCSPGEILLVFLSWPSKVGLPKVTMSMLPRPCRQQLTRFPFACPIQWTWAHRAFCRPVLFIPPSNDPLEQTHFVEPLCCAHRWKWWGKRWAPGRMDALCTWEQWDWASIPTSSTNPYLQGNEKAKQHQQASPTPSKSKAASAILVLADLSPENTVSPLPMAFKLLIVFDISSALIPSLSGHCVFLRHYSPFC